MGLWKVAVYSMLIGAVLGLGKCGFSLYNIIQDMKKKEKEEEPFYETYFLTDKGYRSQDGTNIDIGLEVNTRPIVKFIQSSKKTLDLCYYSIDSNSIIRAILEAKQRGVIVRLITDYNVGFRNNASAKKLMNGGVIIYATPTDKRSIMHNKFSIVDNEMLMTGSLNWTTFSLNGGFENFIITNDKIFVVPFIEQFNIMLESMMEMT